MALPLRKIMPPEQTYEGGITKAMRLPTRDDVHEAYHRIGKRVVHTPLVYSEELSRLSGAHIHLKLETLQHTGAFKYRGALNFVGYHAAERRGVVAASSGNHALGIALACQKHGLEATVVMPSTAPAVKQAKARAYGAHVICHGEVYDEAREHAQSLAAQRNLLFAPSFDHFLIIAGQGTIGCELKEQIPQADMILVPVGGGGLMAGLMLALPDHMRLWGVQAQGAASMVASLKAQKLVSLTHADTIADGIATLRPGAANLWVIQSYAGNVLAVSDADIRRAMAFLLGAGIVAEPAAAAPLAAVLNEGVAAKGKTVVLVITGRNISGSLLEETAKSWASQPYDPT